MATGIAVIVLSLLTDYRFGLFRVIPFWVHLTVDGLVGLAFTAIPTALGFGGVDAFYYWINAAGVLAVVTLGQTRQAARIDPASQV